MIGPLLVEVLEDLGHIVVAVEVDAEAAVAAARNCRPDLIVVDIKLSESSGVAAAKEVIRNRFVPHVFVTGDLLRSLEFGPEAVLIQKPYSRTTSSRRSPVRSAMPRCWTRRAADGWRVGR